VSDLVVHNRRDHRGALAETTAKPADDIVLAAAFPDLEIPCIAHAAKAGIETKHNFAERGTVPFGLAGRLDLHDLVHCLLPANSLD